MPYDVRKNDKGKWECYNSDTGKVMGTFDTKSEADDQMKALYANVKETIVVRYKG
jgi:hypothetical protein